MRYFITYVCLVLLFLLCSYAYADILEELQEVPLGQAVEIYIEDKTYLVFRISEEDIQAFFNGEIQLKRNNLTTNIRS